VVLTRSGKMINMKHRQTITEALISAHCDPQIKRRIIDNAIFDHYKSLLNEILDEIRQSGYAANFDGTDLSDLDLSRLNLTRVSAVSAKFIRSYLCSANLTDADRTGAWFQSSTLISVNLNRTILHKAFICDSDLSDACLNRTDLNQIQLQRVKTAHTLFTDVMTDNAELQKY
jgi:secreted effector protein PipB2